MPASTLKSSSINSLIPNRGAAVKRPAVEEFKRLASLPASAWGMADSDVVHLCDYILHLEAQNASMRRTFGSDPIFNEKQAEIGRLRAKIEKADYLLTQGAPTLALEALQET